MIPEEVTVMETSEHRQELDLARRAHDGDETAWRQIYETTCQPLFNVLCYQTGDREAAKDLLQDTYLRAFEYLGSFRGEGSLLSWLRGIALRRATDRWRGLRQQLRRVTRLSDGLAESLADPGASGRANADDARLTVGGDAFQGALRRLSPNQRACLLLHDLAGLSHAEIARELHCNEATVRVHHHRATQRMRNWLEAPVTVPADEMGGLPT
jgi:RNA polymerase sigma-70 factor, ECF subfamily